MYRFTIILTVLLALVVNGLFASPVFGASAAQPFFQDDPQQEPQDAAIMDELLLPEVPTPEEIEDGAPAAGGVTVSAGAESLALAEVTASVSGSQPWVAVMCKFADVAAEPKAPGYFQQIFQNVYPGLDHYWREASYGAIDLQGSAAISAWVTLPNPRSFYVSGDTADLQALAEDCTAAADAQVNYPDFTGIHLMFNDELDGFSWGGSQTLTLDGVTRSWMMTWEPPWGYANLAVLAHDMGHALGMLHSAGDYGVANDNRWDVMSDVTSAPVDPTFGVLPQHPIAYQKSGAITDWIPAVQVVDIPPNTDQVVTLERLAQPTTGSALLVRVQRGLNPESYFTIEARQQVGYDANLPGEGVIIHRIEPGAEPRVIDSDGNGSTGDAGAIWLPGETFTDATYGITITVTAATATGYTVSIHNPTPPTFVSCAAQSRVPEAECNALVDLYNATNGPAWTNRTGWLADVNVCSWFGVACSENHVKRLNLRDNHLVGTLPASIGNLAGLQVLSLPTNQLSGAIPPQIGSLTALQRLELYANSLSGSIPVEIGGLTALQHLYLYNNRLTGAIPTEIGNLTGLQFLVIGSNQLTGAIPPQIGNLTALVYLDLSSNQLNGPIPPELGNLTELRQLFLGTNQLTGTIPPQLGNLTKLNRLFLSSNQLTGSIPPELGNLSGLLYLLLNTNQLSGSIPPELGNLSALEGLYLYANQLTGPIPPELGNLTALQFLSVRSNQLSGPIPPELGNLSSLLHLNLNSNQLSGPIPPELGNLSALQNLYLDTNQLTGSIPPQLGNLSALRYLYLYSNQLTGKIPLEIFNLTGLQSLYLSYNQISGSIPPEIGNLTALQSLSLSSNQLTGPLPSQLGSLTNLRGLYIASNQLTGSIPPELGNLTALQYLYLNNNQLSGSIPPEIGNLTGLLQLRLQNNQLSGSIPPQIGNLTALRQLYLNVNQLSGAIPPEIGNLTALQQLNLSANQLSGAVPAEIGNLTQLQSLELRANRLTGGIPASIGRLTGLQLINLEGNALVGPIPAAFTQLSALTSLDLDYNGLYSTDPAVIAFLNAKNAAWAATQTAPPLGVEALPVGNDIQVNWQAIPFTAGAGGYDIYYSTSASGPFSKHGGVTSKTVTTYLATGLTPGVQYYFYVQSYTSPHVYNANTIYSDPSAVATASRPSAFSKTAPANGAVDRSYSSLTLTWGAAAPVTHYLICVAANSYTCTWTDVGNVTSYTVTNLLPNTRYNWQVRAYNGTLMTSANGGTWWSFTTRQAPPAAFSKTAPASGAVDQPYSLTLSWEAAVRATHYTICVAANSYTCAAWQDVGNVTSYTVSGLLQNTRYNWQVRAYNGTLMTSANGGAWWSFTTRPQTPSAFNKTAPASGAADQPYTSLTLSWEASTPVTSYAVCVAANSYTCTTWRDVGKSTSYTVRNLLPNTRYNWQVRAYNGAVYTSANGGAWWSFTTRQAPPAAFGKLTPINEAAGQPYTSLTLTWQATSPVTHYLVCVTVSYTCVWWDVGTNTSYTVTNLLPNTRYNWQVRAYNGTLLTSADGGVWWNFITMP